MVKTSGIMIFKISEIVTIPSVAQLRSYSSCAIFCICPCITLQFSNQCTILCVRNVCI